MTFGDILPMLRESVRTYGGLAFVLAFATAFGRVLSMTRATKVVESFILGNFTSGVAVLTVLVLIFLLLGMVMDTGPAIIILVPVLLPACKNWGWIRSIWGWCWYAACPSGWRRRLLDWICLWPGTLPGSSP